MQCVGDGIKTRGRDRRSPGWHGYH
jgi:hypothetical protein